MSRAAIDILGAARFDELVAATRAHVPALVDEVDPYMCAALLCVAHRVLHSQTYGWSRYARGVAMSLAISAAIRAEEMDRNVAA